MRDNVEEVIHSITKAPNTFINLAQTYGSYAKVIGPNTVDRYDATPKYGFTDAVIESFNPNSADESNIHLCGSFFVMSPEKGEGSKAIPLMMRLARANIIKYAGFSEGIGRDAWKVTKEAGHDMKQIVEAVAYFPLRLQLKAEEIISHESKLEAGRNFYSMLEKMSYEWI